MRNRFMSGIVTGSILGATLGAMAYGRMSPRQKKALMRGSNKMIKNAANMIGNMSSMNMFK